MVTPDIYALQTRGRKHNGCAPALRSSVSSLNFLAPNSKKNRLLKARAASDSPGLGPRSAERKIKPSTDDVLVSGYFYSWLASGTSEGARGTSLIRVT